MSSHTKCDDYGLIQNHLVVDAVGIAVVMS